MARGVVRVCAFHLVFGDIVSDVGEHLVRRRPDIGNRGVHFFGGISSSLKLHSEPPVGSKVCSLPPARGAWRIGGAGERSSGRLFHQMARPFFCDSTSSGCAARKSRMKLVSSDSYMAMVIGSPTAATTGSRGRRSWRQAG